MHDNSLFKFVYCTMIFIIFVIKEEIHNAFIASQSFTRTCAFVSIGHLKISRSLGDRIENLFTASHLMHHSTRSIHFNGSSGLFFGKNSIDDAWTKPHRGNSLSTRCWWWSALHRRLQQTTLICSKLDTTDPRPPGKQWVCRTSNAW